MVGFQCGEFLQNVVNLSGVVDKIETHQSTVIRNDTVLPYILYSISLIVWYMSRISNFDRCYRRHSPKLMCYHMNCITNGVVYTWIKDKLISIRKY